MADFSFWVILSNLLLAARWTVAAVARRLRRRRHRRTCSAVRARLEQAGWLELLTKVYIEFFQGTPLLMQLFLFFFGIALFGIECRPGSRPGSR